MATAITAANLFGSESTYQIVSDRATAEIQQDRFPGLVDSLFITSLGGSGRFAEFTGLLRGAAAATSATAGANLNTIISAIENYWRLGTLLDLFSGDSSKFAGIYKGSGTAWRGTIFHFDAGNRTLAVDAAATVRVVAQFRMVYRIIAKV